MDGERFGRGLMEAGKATATAIPAAVLADVVIARVARIDTYAEKTATRLGVGLILTAAALLLDAPVAFAVGPVVGNAAVAGVEASRHYALDSRIRNMFNGNGTGTGT